MLISVSLQTNMVEEEDIETIKYKSMSSNQLGKELNNFTLSPDDRPITPLRDKMVYDPRNSSLDFEDGKLTEILSSWCCRIFVFVWVIQNTPNCFHWNSRET